MRRFLPLLLCPALLCTACKNSETKSSGVTNNATHGNSLIGSFSLYARSVFYRNERLHCFGNICSTYHYDEKNMHFRIIPADQHQPGC